MNRYPGRRAGTALQDLCGANSPTATAFHVSQQRSTIIWRAHANSAKWPKIYSMRVYLNYSSIIACVLWCLLCCRQEPSILSTYGTLTPVTGQGRRTRVHDGVDVAAHIGDVVISADGVVVRVKNTKHEGGSVYVRHDRIPTTATNRGANWWTAYGHLNDVDVSVGTRVVRGQRLGRVGIFPASEGVSHVHWQLCADAACFVTRDPLSMAGGCFEKQRSDSDASLVLTLPISCH